MKPSAQPMSNFCLALECFSICFTTSVRRICFISWDLSASRCSVDSFFVLPFIVLRLL